MSAGTICPNCRVHVPAGAYVCGHCRRRLGASSATIVLVLVTVSVVLLGSFNSCKARSNRIREPSLTPLVSPAPVVSLTPVVSPTPVKTMTAAEHLAAAWHDLGYGFKNYRGQLDDARKHLEAIPAGSPEFAKARKLMTEVKRREANEAADRRLQVARDMEIGFLEKGMDVHVSVHGVAKTTLRLEYVLMSRPLLYQILKEGNLELIRNAGFKRLTFTDGYHLEWTMPVR